MANRVLKAAAVGGTTAAGAACRKTFFFFHIGGDVGQEGRNVRLIRAGYIYIFIYI